MKAIKAILLILTLTIVSCETIDKAFILEKFMDNPKELFKAYYTIFNKEDTYDINSLEGVRRFKIFNANVDWIKEENAKAGVKVYGINQFTDLTHAEFNIKYLMRTDELEADFNLDFSNIKPDTPTENNKFIGDVPNIDWRSYMNPVKNQLTCGACWAFASIATVEGNYNISFKTLYNLSEQYLVSCDDTDNGCNGGYPTAAGNWMTKFGVISTSEYPYTATRSLCRAEFQEKALNILKNFETCSSSCPSDEWYAMLAKGPITVLLDASSRNFSLYAPSSIDTPWVPYYCQQVNYAATVVGVKVVNGVTLLIVRNSMGSTWGYQGHFSINAANPCFIMKYAWRAVTQLNQPFPAPVCPTFASDCTTTAKTVTSCRGIVDSTSTTSLGTTMKGYTQVNDSRTWTFYQGKNCTGNSDLKTQTETCFANFKSKYMLTEYSSATNNVDIPSKGCVLIYTGPCSTGYRYHICNDIADLPVAGITSIGTVLFNTSYSENTVALVFFDQKDFAGNGVSIGKSQLYNLSDKSYFTNFIPKALSVAIIKYSP